MYMEKSSTPLDQTRNSQIECVEFLEEKCGIKLYHYQKQMLLYLLSTDRKIIIMNGRCG